MAVATADRVSVAVAEHVADVRLVRGEKHNALDWPMFVAINEAIDEVGSAPGVRCVVLSGEGPSFCSGLDFASFMAGDGEIGDMFERRDGEDANLAQRVSYGWQALAVPVIAACHGASFGGGLQIALGADVRIAAPDARFSVMEMKYGLIPDMGISASLPDLVRVDAARELLYTGRIVEAPEALELGMVTRIADDPVAEAQELAATIAANSPDAVRSAKRLARDGWARPVADRLAMEEELQRALLGSPNQTAAAGAALSKQPASFEDPQPA